MADNFYYGTGRRKSAVARVFMKRGSGNIVVNGKPVDEFFSRVTGRMIVRQPLDHLGAPALAALALQDVAAYLPVQQHQFAVDRQRGALLGAMDAGFELGQPVGIARWRRGDGNRALAHASTPALRAQQRSADHWAAPGCAASSSSQSICVPPLRKPDAAHPFPSVPVHSRPPTPAKIKGLHPHPHSAPWPTTRTCPPTKTT